MGYGILKKPGHTRGPGKRGAFLQMKVPAKGFTHGGKFHADDVFATALLRILRPDFAVTRGFEVPEGFEGIVYDIGDGMFDHHSADRALRPGGVPLSLIHI